MTYANLLASAAVAKKMLVIAAGHDCKTMAPWLIGGEYSITKLPFTSADIKEVVLHSTNM